MFKVVCTIRDEAAQLYMNPIIDDNENTAKRNFYTAVWRAQVEEDGAFWSSPQDFSLWKIGIFDDVEGTVSPLVPERLCTASEALFEYNRWKESEV